MSSCTGEPMGPECNGGMEDVEANWGFTQPLFEKAVRMAMHRNGDTDAREIRETPPAVTDDSSRWATEREFIAGLSSAPIDSDEDIPAGGVPLAVVNGRVYFDAGDSHTITYGITGSKKTFGVGVPACYLCSRAGESLFVSDSKGDILCATAYDLVRHGYRIIVFDLRNPEHSARWNPLAFPYQLHKSENQTDRDKAQKMLLNISEELSPVVGKDPYWDLSCQRIIYGLCNVLFNTCTDPEKINFSSLYSLKGSLMNQDVDLAFYLDSNYCTPAEHDSLMVSEGTSDITRRCILGMFDRALSPFTSMDMITWLTSTSDFDFADLGREKTALFVISPDENSSFDFLVSMMISQCYQSLVSLAQSSPDRRLSIRVNFILDEFGNLPMIKDMDRMITASRSRGMKFLLLLQDRSQLEHRYGKEMASTIMSNCGNIMYLNGRDLSLIRDLSMMAGTDASGKAIVSTSRLQRLDKEKGEVFILRDRMYPYISTLPFATAYSQFAISEPELPSHTRIEVPVFDIEEDFDPFWKLNASNGYHVHVEDVSGDGRETTENDGRTTSNDEELTDEQRADMIDEILRMLSSDDDD